MSSQQIVAQHAIREYAFLLLYESLMCGTSRDETEQLFEQAEDLIGSPVPDKTRRIVEGVLAHREPYENIVASYSRTRKLNRIAPLNRAILLLALYELNCTDTPENVVISEAVLLARAYTYDEDTSFINGVLGAYVRDREQARDKIGQTAEKTKEKTGDKTEERTDHGADLGD